MSAFDNVAARLRELLPTRPSGEAITAWDAAAAAWNRHAARLRELEARVARLEAQGPPPPPPPPSPPPPSTSGLAPLTYNAVPERNINARFCVAGLPRDHTGALTDGVARYDDDGLQLGAERSEGHVPGLKPADAMDGRGPCDPYEWLGRRFPPWPSESYLR